MSTDFKRMVELMLKQKPEINAEQIRDLIDEKKRNIGAGYLTDQGALFLVAADLGISFENVQKSHTGIKDLFIGAKEVNITARIMNIYPIRKFNKRDTNEEIKTRTLTVYDKESSTKIKLWDDQINTPDDIGLRSGDLIRISRCYIKSGLDGKPIINLGSSGSIEPAIDNDDSIPNIDSITITVDDVKEPKENAAITGIINSNPRISEFTNTRGEISKSLQMQISNENNTYSLRVVIWNIDERKLPKVFNTGAKVRLIGVKIKEGNPQYSSANFEIHGDEGTILEFTGTQSEVEVMPLRIISIGKESGRRNISCLAVDRNGRFMSIIIDNTMVNDEIVTDTIIECIPSRIFGSSVIISKDDSYIRIMEDDTSFPRLSKLESKIKDIQVSENPYILEAIVLQAPNTTEVNTKSRESVLLTDTFIGDDTGEIRLLGWRDQSSFVNKLNVGDRILVIGATANNSREGKVELTLKPYSSITKIS